MKKVPILLIIAFLALGCVGPNRITRGLDLKFNQLYEDNPSLAEVLLPVQFVGMNLTLVADACFLNPWYFWREAPAGRGTAYYYRDPVTPENEDPLEASKLADTAGDAASFADASSLPADAALPIPQGPSHTVTYTVQPGDTFSSIAKASLNYLNIPLDTEGRAGSVK